MDTARKNGKKEWDFERKNICAAARLRGICTRTGRKGAIAIFVLSPRSLLNRFEATFGLTWFVHFSIPFYAGEGFSSQLDHLELFVGR